MLLLVGSFSTDHHAKFSQRTPNNCSLIMRRNKKQEGMKTASSSSQDTGGEQRELASQATNTTSALVTPVPTAHEGIAVTTPVVSERTIGERSSAKTTSYSAAITPSASRRYSNIAGGDFTRFRKNEEDDNHNVIPSLAAVAENESIANKTTTTSSETLCRTNKSQTERVQNRTTAQHYYQYQYAGLLADDNREVTTTASQKAHATTSVAESGDQCLYQRFTIGTGAPSTLRAPAADGSLIPHRNPTAANFQNAPSNITAQDLGLSVNIFFDSPLDGMLEPRPIEEMIDRQDDDNVQRLWGGFVQFFSRRRSEAPRWLYNAP
jgi:hypothetical protein